MSIRFRWMAYFRLFENYWTVFRHYWKIREINGRNVFKENEAAFLPPVLALQEHPTSPTFLWTARTLVALLVTSIAWSIIARIDIVVSADGKIVPAGRIKTIASIEVASVRSLHVVEGQIVKAGQTLIELDTSAYDAERDKARGDQSTALLQVVRAKAFMAAITTGIVPHLSSAETVLPKKLTLSSEQWAEQQRYLEGMYRDFKIKHERCEAEILRLEAELPLVSRRASDYKILFESRDVSEHAWFEKEQTRLDIDGQLAGSRNQCSALMAENRRYALDQISEGNRVAASAHEDAEKAAARSTLLKLTAPVDGTVQQLSVHTVGGVVPAAQALMQIVPTATEVDVEAFIDNKDIGFVAEGNQADVKIDAFDYGKYGTISARVVRVSRDSILDEKRGLLYGASVKLDNPSIIVEGRRIKLSPGMSVKVNIKTGDRRIIEYVLSPLVHHAREAMHER